MSRRTRALRIVLASAVMAGVVGVPAASAFGGTPKGQRGYEGQPGNQGGGGGTSNGLRGYEGQPGNQGG